MSEPAAERVVICRIAGRRFALPVAQVREVVGLPAVLRLPGVPAAVRGIANVHGTLVTAISGPRLLALPAGGEEYLIVLGLEHGRVGITVDEVEDVEVHREATQWLELEALLRPLLAAAG